MAHREQAVRKRGGFADREVEAVGTSVFFSILVTIVYT